MRKAIWLALASLVIGASGTLPGLAATPAGATIEGSGALDWDFAPVQGVFSSPSTSVVTVNGQPTLDTCVAGTSCDTFALKVVAPPQSLLQTQFEKLAIDFTWDPSSNEQLTFYAISPDGSRTLQAKGGNASLPAVSGTASLVLIDPAPGAWTITEGAWRAPLPVGAHAHAALSTGSLVKPLPSSYQTYLAPAPLGQRSGEPSIGADLKTGAVMYQADTETEKVLFDDSVSPAKASWTNVAGPITGTITADPILFTDQQTNRTFVSEDIAACSLLAYTDDDGGTWNPSEGCDLPAGVDHPSVGGGPMPPAFPLPMSPAANGYPDAVYYCSQNVVEVQCGISIDGGNTFLPDAPAWNEETSGPAGSPGCDGLHGHIKVGPDGTAYVPLHNCASSIIDLGRALNDPTNAPNYIPAFDGHRGLAVSHDGITWNVSLIGDSSIATNFGDTDPSVATDAANTLYYAYQNGDGTPRVAVSHDDGKTFSPSVNVGAAFGIKNTEFAEMVAGDPGKAAFAFLGTATGGDDQQADFPGLWDLYVSTTLDDGKTWNTVDATPGNPVQRGCIWNQGGSNQCRNLLDFNDATIDAKGRVLIAYTKGCSLACASDAGGNTYDSIAAIARQTCGPTVRGRDLGPCPGEPLAAVVSQAPHVVAASGGSVQGAQRQGATLPNTSSDPHVPAGALLGLGLPLMALALRRRGAIQLH